MNAEKKSANATCTNLSTDECGIASVSSVVQPQKLKFVYLLHMSDIRSTPTQLIHYQCTAKK